MHYMGGSSPAKADTQVIAAAPTFNLWVDLEELWITTAQGVIPIEVVLECFQKVLVLLGNASNYMSLNCRDTKYKIHIIHM